MFLFTSVLLNLQSRPPGKLEGGVDEMARFFRSGSNKRRIKGSTNMSLSKFIPPNPDRFFYYRGSFTTPNCREGVTWIVFNEAIQASKAIVCFTTRSQIPFCHYGNNLILINFIVMSLQIHWQCLLKFLTFSFDFQVGWTSVFRQRSRTNCYT